MMVDYWVLMMVELTVELMVGKMDVRLVGMLEKK